MAIINIPSVRKVPGYATAVMSTKKPEDYQYLLHKHIKDIILFEDSKEDIDYISEGKIILPRYHSVFVGTKNSEIQFKPYEYDANRIVVTTLNDIIMSIDSIG